MTTQAERDLSDAIEAIRATEKLAATYRNALYQVCKSTLNDKKSTAQYWAKKNWDLHRLDLLERAEGGE